MWWRIVLGTVLPCLGVSLIISGFHTWAKNFKILGFILICIGVCAFAGILLLKPVINTKINSNILEHKRHSGVDMSLDTFYDRIDINFDNILHDIDQLIKDKKISYFSMYMRNSIFSKIKYTCSIELERDKDTTVTYKIEETTLDKFIQEINNIVIKIKKE
jgi:hypothetical protein